MTGKIIFYNEAVGNGIILTSDKMKFSFSIFDWDDFEYVPAVGLPVVFERENDVAKFVCVFTDEDEDGSHLQYIENQPITTESVIQRYFTSMYRDISQFDSYRRTPHSIDFLKLRRFLLTSYNNLIEMDAYLLQTEVSAIKNDLIELSEIYDMFKLRSKHIKKAFYDLFLNQSEEFLQAKERLEKNKITLGQYELKIRLEEITLKNLESSLEKNISLNDDHEEMEKATKKSRSLMIDAIHNKREMEEESKRLAEFIEMIVAENEESFQIKFLAQAEIFHGRIVEILNKVAYVFETNLWKKARKSKIIRKYFSHTNANGKLSSTTYLKYYLQSLDTEKLSSEHKELFELLPYMESLQHRSVIYLHSDSQNAHKVKQILNEIDKKIELHSLNNPQKVLQILDNELPDFLFLDQKAEFKTIFHYLKRNDLLEEVTIIFFMNKITRNSLERAKQLHIDFLIPSNTPIANMKEIVRSYMI